MFTYCQVVALHTLWAWTRLMLYPTTSRTFNKNPPENINHFIIKQWWGVSLATLCKGSWQPRTVQSLQGGTVPVVNEALLDTDCEILSASFNQCLGKGLFEVTNDHVVAWARPFPFTGIVGQKPCVAQATRVASPIKHTTLKYSPHLLKFGMKVWFKIKKRKFGIQDLSYVGHKTQFPKCADMICMWKSVNNDKLLEFEFSIFHLMHDCTPYYCNSSWTPSPNYCTPYTQDFKISNSCAKNPCALLQG